MRRRIALGLVLCMVVLLVGPRATLTVPDVGAIVRAVPESLVEIPAFLARREASVPGVHANTEKRIAWAPDDSGRTTPRVTHYAVVYLHGFSATRQETAPFSEQLAAALHANLFETRLTGHGLPGEAMGRATAGDWIADAVEAMTIGQRIGDSVIVVATSTGGTLALWLAAQPDSLRRRLSSLILISPNLAIKDPTSRVLTWPWMPQLLPRIIPERHWSSNNAEQERYWTTTYPSTALFPLAALVKDVRSLDASRITTPMLVFTNRGDNVVDAAATSAFLDRVRNARVERVDVVPAPGEDRHVIVGRIVSPSQVPRFVGRALEFVAATSSRTSSSTPSPR
jgi:esterase/lipase